MKPGWDRRSGQAFEAWQAGTAPITDVFPVDMVWRIEGHSDASKEYADRKQFIEEVLAPFGARFPSGERFRPIRIRSIYADGDTVLVVWTATESPTGARTRTATPD